MNVKESDLFLIPDPSTLTVLPWRPSHGRVVRFFCDIRHPDGTPFAGDGRQLLKQAVAELNDLGLTCQVGTELSWTRRETRREYPMTALGIATLHP